MKKSGHHLLFTHRRRWIRARDASMDLFPAFQLISLRPGASSLYCLLSLMCFPRTAFAEAVPENLSVLYGEPDKLGVLF